jgi:hypothetical protein
MRYPVSGYYSQKEDPAMTHRLASATLILSALLALSGCPCSAPIAMTLTPMEPGEFDKAFEVTGPYGFEGILYNPLTDDLRWELEGTFQFPHPGYTLLTEVQIAESFPEQVRILFEVVIPAPGVYPEVIDEVAVDEMILVSDSATFEFTVQDRCWPGTAVE